MELEEQQQAEQQAFMADLDFVPGDDEETNPEEPEVETAPEVPEVKEPASEIEAQPEVEEPKETREELLAKYKLQVATYQKKYEEKRVEAETRQAELDEIKKAQVVVPQEAAQPQPQPTITQAQIRSHYEPEIIKAVEAGYVEETFAEEYPNAMSQFLYHRDIIYGLSRRVTELVNSHNQRFKNDQVSEIDRKFSDLFDTTAKHGGFYEPLADPEIREGFKKYLIDLNPYSNQLTEEYVAGQWLAYNREAILKAVPGGIPTPTPTPKKFAQGEGGSNRPGKVSTGKVKQPWDDI